MTNTNGEPGRNVGSLLTSAGCALMAAPVVLLLGVLLIAFMVAAVKAAFGG